MKLEGRLVGGTRGSWREMMMDRSDIIYKCMNFSRKNIFLSCVFWNCPWKEQKDTGEVGGL